MATRKLLFLGATSVQELPDADILALANLSVSTTFTYGQADNTAKYLRINSSPTSDCAIDFQHSGLTLMRFGLGPDNTANGSLYSYDNAGNYLGAVWYTDRLNLLFHLTNPLGVADGGTGGNTQLAARTALGITPAGNATIAFSGGAVVANGTYPIEVPYAATLNTLKYEVGTAGGSFTVAVTNAGTTVTGLSAVAVSATATTTANATANNVIVAGTRLVVTISGVTGSPTNAVLVLTWTKN